jgi:hypothetical protein
MSMRTSNNVVFFVKCISQVLALVGKEPKKPISVYFDFLDVVTPLTPAMTNAMLEEAFACGCETVDDDKANAIIFNINRIQENMMARSLDWTDFWRLFESDPNFGPHEEAFHWIPPGFSMLMLMAWLKKKLFTKLHPDVEYGGSIMDVTLIRIWTVQEQRAIDENLAGIIDTVLDDDIDENLDGGTDANLDG